MLFVGEVVTCGSLGFCHLVPNLVILGFLASWLILPPPSPLFFFLLLSALPVPNYSLTTILIILFFSISLAMLLCLSKLSVVSCAPVISRLCGIVTFFLYLSSCMTFALSKFLPIGCFTSKFMAT